MTEIVPLQSYRERWPVLLNPPACCKGEFYLVYLSWSGELACKKLRDMVGGCNGIDGI